MKQLGSFSRLAGVAALCALVANLSLAAAETGKAEITGIKGTVTVDGLAVKVGDSIKPGQQISTGAASELNLFLGENGPTLMVDSNASVSFDELSYDKSGAEPVINTKNVKAGKVAGYVKKTSSQSKYVVQTPTVTAAIRGTKYQVSEDGTVAVWEGSVSVTYRGNTYEVSEGQKFDPSVGAVVLNDLQSPFRGAPINTTASTALGGAVIITPTRPNPGASEVQPGR